MSNVEVIKKIVSTLESRWQTIGFAESCTGGLVSAEVAELPGVSKVFSGSIVSYSNEVKASVLGVPEELLQTFGAVSAQVALKMAEGARDVLKTSWAVSITGIAGPTGGSANKPVGTVFFAVVGPGVASVESSFFEGSRTEVQAKSAQFALNLLWSHLDLS